MFDKLLPFRRQQCEVVVKSEKNTVLYKANHKNKKLVLGKKKE